MAVSTEKSVPNLYGWDREALTEWVVRREQPVFRGRQIYRWLYGHRSLDPVQWTDLPGDLRESVTRTARVDAGRVEDRARAADGTVKYRIGLAEGGAAEAVYMTYGERVTLCVSSQVGCALACDFCLTGRMGLVRHMSSGEIAGQIALIESEQKLRGRRYNLVFMGMGEPLHNYEGLTGALRLLTDPEGFALSRRRITVSTAGVAPAIERLAGEPARPRLAVSLNATTDELRDRLMPINRRYPLPRLLDACETFARASGERLTFEYVLLRGVNDSTEDVRRLAGIARTHRAKINLIPFNEVPGHLPYRSPVRTRIETLRDELAQRGVRASIRWSRGAGARAACGQLALLPGEPGGAASTQAEERR